MDIRKIDEYQYKDYYIKLVVFKRGRFKEEMNFVFSLYKKENLIEKFFLYGKIFYGRDYYRPWLEIAYNEKYDYELIEKFLEPFLLIMPKNSHVMINYDFHMYKVLLSTEPENTWLGKMFLRNGYRNFKNWYIPEGYKEGSYKLQAEKL
ncbi:MAG: DUF1122 family protein [candidate division WOR-3 bacterium]|nr:DUF1122 family protein [candidate division WOR-3 bacterium]MCX7948053.1 DUF1122 family protein [candidate division WOR-3 bacterium]MDW8151009.1 DUF1122 family protein [candidate division WOR-3 bacterium]